LGTTALNHRINKSIFKTARVSWTKIIQGWCSLKKPGFEHDLTNLQQDKWQQRKWLHAHTGSELAISESFV